MGVEPFAIAAMTAFIVAAASAGWSSIRGTALRVLLLGGLTVAFGWATMILIAAHPDTAASHFPNYLTWVVLTGVAAAGMATGCAGLYTDIQKKATV